MTVIWICLYACWLKGLRLKFLFMCKKFEAIWMRERERGKWIHLEMSVSVCLFVCWFG